MSDRLKDEREQIARLLAENFTPGEYDPSDFEWCAYQLQMAGFHRERDVKLKVLNHLLKEIREEHRKYLREAKNAINDDLYIVYRAKAAAAYEFYTYIFNLNNKYVKERNKEEANDE